MERMHGCARGTARVWAYTLAAAGVLGGSAMAQVGSTQRVSLDSTGVQGNGDSDWGSFSGDGRWVVFQSTASNFAAGDGNGLTDVFLHDRLLGTTTLVSRSVHGSAGDAASWGGSISADGRYVAFSSSADDLVPNDANGIMTDMFVLDRAAGTLALVSVSSTGLQANDDSGWGAISADGQRVAYVSKATNLVPGVSSGWYQIYVYDRTSGTTAAASLAPGGVEGDGDCWEAHLSADGRLVSFQSGATNLVPGDANGSDDVFVRDLQTGLTECVSVDPAGVPGNAASFAGRIAANGRFVAFSSVATNLVAGDTNAACDAFVRDRLTGATERVDLDSAGNQANGGCYPPTISDDGRFVGFESSASNLVPGDTNQQDDVFVHDRSNGETRLAGLSSTGGPCASGTYEGNLSPDGRFIAFSSQDAQVVPGDTNSSLDLFVRDLQGNSPTIASYCTAGTTTHGCVPSIRGIGTPSASAGSGFTIDVDFVEGNKSGLILYGLSGPQNVPWGSGFLCVRSPLQRIGVLASGGTSGSCDGHLAIDWNQFIASHPGALGTPFQGGEVVWAQALFRDPWAPSGSSLSDGLWFDVCP